MSWFQLRAARSTDAGSTGSILSAFIDENDWMPRIHTRAQDVGFAGHMIDRGWVTVAESAEGVIGFLARDNSEIHALYVAQSGRRKGCGTALLQHAKGLVQTLSLWTFQKNVAAQTFYLKHGFLEAERTDGTGNDEHLPDIRYIWTGEDR